MLSLHLWCLLFTAGETRWKGVENRIDLVLKANNEQDDFNIIVKKAIQN